MDSDLERYLLAILVVSNLIAGLLVTRLWVSAVSTSATALLVPGVAGAIVFGLSLAVAGSLARDR